MVYAFYKNHICFFLSVFQTAYTLHLYSMRGGIKALKCCDRKSRAAYAQSFAPWQQATIEITRRDHSIIACSSHIHIFLFCAHIPFVVNHTINATLLERLQQKHNLRTTLQFSNHGCKYLTHTNKTPHVKCTQMVVTVRFTIRVTSLHR